MKETGGDEEAVDERLTGRSCVAKEEVKYAMIVMIFGV